MTGRRGIAAISAALTVLGYGTLQAQAERRVLPAATEVRRYAAAEARQGVALDERYLYAIDNRTIGKYDRITGARIAEWSGPADGPIQHLNSGIIRDGKLYAVNSNYPRIPMVSSIEIFDLETMRHVGSHSFGIHGGSATWIDVRDGDWWVAFVNYDGRGGVPGRGVEWSTLERFDREWRRTGGYAFPSALVERFRPYSNSGGVWTDAGHLLLTGHDAAELYLARLPSAGSTLEWVATIPAPIAGQAIARDPTDPRVIFGIQRASTEVVGFRLPDQVR